uniref:Amino acid transporter transmembrane domain-containing protein n=1 Tax=Kalanchoe fedtschenkoi TaxID=63787 RepID=A0A7N0UNR8_KALFE
MATDELRTPLTTGAVTGSSFIKACFNGTNSFLGIGLLTVPYALSRGGWLSLLLFLLIGLISFYTGILLKRWSIFVVLGSFIIPCLCYLKISRSRRRWGYETTAIILILIFSATAAIIGTYSSIVELFSSSE